MQDPRNTRAAMSNPARNPRSNPESVGRIAQPATSNARKMRKRTGAIRLPMVLLRAMG